VDAVHRRARDGLGEAAFTDAYERGLTMSAGDLVALARSAIT
jgi:hypothetical protein